MPELDQEVVPSQVQDSNPAPESTPAAEPSEQSLDQRLESEREEMDEVDEANGDADEGDGGDAEGAGEGEDDAGEEGEDGGETEGYTPKLKYKVHGQEFPIDQKFKKVLNAETEPLIRELHEKAHGIEAVKVSRDKAVQERDSINTSFQDLTGRVGRLLNLKKAGDLESFFEGIQLTDEQIAKYILEKAEIQNLPPELRAVYNERKELRRQTMALQEANQTTTQSANQTRVQARIGELDQVLGDPNTKRVADAYDARNGAGSFRQAVMEHGHTKWITTKKDLSAQEAVDSLIKTYGIQSPKAQPKPGVEANRRVVKKPKVSTIPNLGSSQASVTHVKKPKSIDEIKAMRKEKYGV